MKNVRFFNPGESYRRIKPEIDKIMQDVLERGDLILRKDVEEFERNLAGYVGTKYAVGVASGTDALILSLTAAGVGPGDEVITCSYTFRGTVEAIHRVGAKTVLADLDEDWEPYKTNKTKAIIPCHIAGEVTRWVPDEDVVMIEDACQAIGAAPITGLAACYSFYPAKILGCYGDGGAIATNDRELYEKLKAMRNHYKDDWGPYGFNSRLDNLHAAVLNFKIQTLEDAIWRRKQVARRYDDELQGVGLPRIRDVYQDYIITHSERDRLQTYLKANGIETMQNGYPFPQDLMKGRKTLEYEAKSLRIPCNPDLTEEEVDYVIETINNYGV